MATLFEYNMTTPTSWPTQFYGVYWYAQSFSPQVKHSITSAMIYAFKIGSPGDFTIGVRNTLSSLPTGVDLTSGLISANSWIGNDWREVVFDNSLVLDSGIEYALVMRAPNGNSSNKLYVSLEDGATYTRGIPSYSSDSGDTWSGVALEGYDFLFQDWGDAIIAPRITGFVPKINFIQASRI